VMSHLPCQEQEPLITEHEFKCIVFNAQPCPICDQNTLKYDDGMHTITLTTLEYHLSWIQWVVDYKRSGWDQPNKKHKGNNGGSLSSNCNNNGNNNNNDKRGGSKGAAFQIPGHSGHLWKGYHANKHSPNYDKDFVPSAWLQDGKSNNSNNQGSKPTDKNMLSSSLQSYSLEISGSMSNNRGQTETGRSAHQSNNT
jgi:hypothetical protein